MERNKLTGFFTKQETQSLSRPDGKTYSCSSCGLYRGARSPQMKPFGNFARGILNIGEAPGEVEDQKGKQWQGPIGRSLQRAYKKLGVDLFEDCININAINCRPPDNRPPTNYEIACCRKRVLQVIKQYNPKIIVLFGNSALESIIGYRQKGKASKITKWRGWLIPDREIGAWICPVFHPSFPERSKDKLAGTIWMQDLKRMLEMESVSFPDWVDEKEYVEIIGDLSPLRKLPNLVVIDYETTGLKPHAIGHRIICAAVATGPKHTFAFMMPKTQRERRPFLDLLADPTTGKMAHHIKFEDTWSAVRLRQPVVNWKWCSMQAAHVLDNRTGITGLKFQTYVNFGVQDYSEEITPFLMGDKKNANSFNRILELLEKPDGKEKLLTYCGLDTIYGFRLAMKQQKELLPF